MTAAIKNNFNFSIDNFSGEKNLLLLPFKYAPGLTPTEKATLNYILVRSGCKKWKINQTDIAKNINVTIRAIEKAMNGLKEAGILKIKRISKKDYFYKITLPEVTKFIKKITDSKIKKIKEKTTLQTEQKDSYDPNKRANVTRTKEQMLPEQNDNYDPNKKGGIYQELDHNILYHNIKSIYSTSLISEKFLRIAQEKFVVVVDKNIKNDLVKNGENMKFNFDEIINFLENEKIENKPDFNQKKNNAYDLSLDEKKEEIQKPVMESVENSESFNPKKSFQDKKVSPVPASNFVSKNHPSEFFSGEKLRLFHELEKKGFGKENNRFNDIKYFLLPLKDEQVEKLRQILEVAKLKGYGAGWIRNQFNNEKFQVVNEGSKQTKPEINRKELNRATMILHRELKLPIGENLQDETFKFFNDRVEFLQAYNSDKSMGKEKFYRSQLDKINQKYGENPDQIYLQKAKETALKILDNRMSGMELDFKEISNKVLTVLNFDIEMIKSILKEGQDIVFRNNPSIDKVTMIVNQIMNYSDVKQIIEEPGIQEEKQTNVIDFTSKIKGFSNIGDLAGKLVSNE